MDFTLIIFVVMISIFIAIVFTLVRNLLKALFYSIGIAILIIILISSFFYMDSYKFSTRNDKLFLMENNSSIIAGIKIKEINEDAFNNPISELKLKEFSILYKDEDYKKILANNNSLFILKNLDINTSFAVFLEENIRDNGYLFILKGIRDKSIEAYPKSFLFKIAEIFPFSWFDNIKYNNIKKRFLNE